MYRLLLTFVLVSLLSPSFAQFKFGPKLGLSLYKVVYHTKEYRNQYTYPSRKLWPTDWDIPRAFSGFKPGLIAGASFEIPVTQTFELRVDPAYTMRGRKVFVEENGWTLDEIHHFIEMPIQLMIQREGNIRQVGPFSQIGPFDWYFGVGPNISYFLGGSGKLETQVLDNPYKISLNSDHSGDIHYVTFTDANRFLWGIDFSVGIISTLGNQNELVTDLKFSYGHSDIGKFNGSSAPILGFADNLASSYRILCLTVSYWYGANLKESKRGKSVGEESISSKKPPPPPKQKKKDINRFKSNKPIRNSKKPPKNINKIKY